MMSTPSPQLPIPPSAPAPPPAFGMATANKKPKAPSMTPTFLGTGTVPQPGQTGTKTLIGQ